MGPNTETVYPMLLKSILESRSSLNGFGISPKNSALEEIVRRPSREGEILMRTQQQATAPGKDFYNLEIRDGPEPILYIDEIPISAKNLSRTKLSDPRMSSLTLKEFSESKTNQDEIERIFGKENVESIILLAKKLSAERLETHEAIE